MLVTVKVSAEHSGEDLFTIQVRRPWFDDIDATVIEEVDNLWPRPFDQP